MKTPSKRMKPAPARCASAGRRSAKPGDLLVFGRYPQTAAGADRTPIRWRVLRNTGAELFVLSERILDAKRYHGAFADTTWRDCDLRKWLNGIATCSRTSRTMIGWKLPMAGIQWSNR